MTPGLIVYSLPPIDWWAGWIPLKKFNSEDFADEYADDDFAPDYTPQGFKRRVETLLHEAQELAASELGFEGDMRQGPFLSALPGENESLPLLAWKQDNNGTTFVASLVPLPHLDDLADSIATYRDGVAVSIK